MVSALKDSMTGLSASSWIFFLGIPKLVGHAYM